jgi:hypothetical protein
MQKGLVLFFLGQMPNAVGVERLDYVETYKVKSGPCDMVQFVIEGKVL